MRLTRTMVTSTNMGLVYCEISSDRIANWRGVIEAAVKLTALYLVRMKTCLMTTLRESKSNRERNQSVHSEFNRRFATFFGRNYGRILLFFLPTKSDFLPLQMNQLLDVFTGFQLKWRGKQIADEEMSGR